jgi:hypothetical protein
MYGWKNNVKMVLKETGTESVDWINLVQVRNQWQPLLKMVKTLYVSQEAVNILSS